MRWLAVSEEDAAPEEEEGAAPELEALELLLELEADAGAASTIRKSKSPTCAKQSASPTDRHQTSRSISIYRNNRRYGTVSVSQWFVHKSLRRRRSGN